MEAGQQAMRSLSIWRPCHISPPVLAPGPAAGGLPGLFADTISSGEELVHYEPCQRPDETCARIRENDTLDNAALELASLNFLRRSVGGCQSVLTGLPLRKLQPTIAGLVSPACHQVPGSGSPARQAGFVNRAVVERTCSKIRCSRLDLHCHLRTPTRVMSACHNFAAET
jgi:hypothetical protein